MAYPENEEQCPECGGSEFGLGVFQQGFATLIPRERMTGSPVEATVCTQCGHILSMRVTKPEKFK